ncbi:MAG: hydroxyacid dehydrogenase [Planctomycetes bacterium]|nr:hydroxyacid dehydrogenase [Planctomycetota bacterium]
MRRLLTAHFPAAPPGLRELLEPRLDGVRVCFDPTSQNDDVEILITGRPTEAQLRASSRLNTLLIPFAGLPRPTLELLASFPDLRVHNLHHNAAPTAELAMALLLAAAKDVVPLDRRLRTGDWRPRYEGNAGLLLEGKRGLVLGYGAIGRRVARSCVAFGMDVIAVNREGRSESPPECTLVAARELDSLWPSSSFVVVCLPLTPNTEGLLGAAPIDALPDDAVIVNIGRGPIIDERALFEALRDGRLGAAGLDVWYRYPETEEARVGTLPSAFPFHELDNVVLSPHRGGHTEAMERLRAEHLAESLNAAARGEPMPWPVNVARGY